jgi:hypothetical protein
MKDIGTTISKIITFIFAGLVITYTSYLTFMLAQRMIPGNVILQVMTLVLFDVSCLCWFVSFIALSRSTSQWAISGIGFLIGLLGSVTMAAGEIILGQKLVVLDDPSTFGWVLIGVMVIAALAHASLTYAFHFFDPGVQNKIENAQAVSKAMNQAYKKARDEIAIHEEEITNELIAATIYEAKRMIQAEVSTQYQRANRLKLPDKSSVIDGAFVSAKGDNKPPVIHIEPVQNNKSATIPEIEEEQEMMQNMVSKRAGVNPVPESASIFGHNNSQMPVNNGNGRGRKPKSPNV